MQAYIQKLGTCLLAVEEHHTEEAEQALTKLSKEAAALVCCMCHFNADTVKVLYGLRLDDGQPVPHQPGDAFYCQLVVRDSIIIPSHEGSHNKGRQGKHIVVCLEGQACHQSWLSVT